MTKSSSANKAWAIALVPLLLSNGSHAADELIFQEMDSKEQIVHLAMVTSRTLMTKGQMVDIDDYDPIDPVPSSKTSVKHGPIQHSIPLIPYLPKPSPPNYPPSP